MKMVNRKIHNDKIVRVPCKIYSGWFSFERCVEVDLSGRRVVAFVDKSFVVPEEDPGLGCVEGFCLAFVIERTGSDTVVELPGSAFIGGLRFPISTGLLKHGN
ncbi:MAG: hypothetical protein QW835_00365 [Candidatus Hadarchaeum sp.]